MRLFRGKVSTGMNGSSVPIECEFDDTATQEEIDEAFTEAVWDKIDAFWEEVTIDRPAQAEGAE